MRRGFGIAGFLATVILLAIVGVVAYNIGWSDGVNTHLPAATQGDGAPAYYYGYGFHPFFAGFGILWFLLILFGIFWLFRLAFWGFAGRRMMMGGGGWGYGPRRWGSFEERAQDWHRHQHEGGSTPGTTPPPPTDTRSV
jgi:hypothetical protein